MEEEATVVVVQEEPHGGIAAVAEQELLGNELWRFGMLFACIAVALAVGVTARFILRRAADRLEAHKRVATAGIVRAAADSLVFLLFVIGAATGLGFLNVIPALAELIDTSVHVLGAIAVGFFLWRLVHVLTEVFERHAAKTESTLDDQLTPILRSSLQIVVVIVIGLQIAQILSDKPITSILAGLGLGGLAVALAAQDSLKNIFGSVVIFGDKPFQVGDRVLVDGYDGPIEEVGLRSTRIRTNTGHLVTIPNGELANKSIENVSKRPFIRRELNVTITYDTPPEKVEEAIQLLKEILATPPGENGRPMAGDINRPNYPPRVYFNDYKPDSLNIFVMYWFFPPAWWDFLELAQWINLEILKRFKEAGIDMAFPTQTIYLAGDPARPLDVGLREVVKEEDGKA